MIFRLQRYIQKKSPYLNKMDWAIIYYVSLIGGVCIAATLIRCAVTW